MNVNALQTFFEQAAQQSLPLALITVYETAGSTYSKAGSIMLADGNGDFCGMLSGGCLEGDLAERARQVIETGEPQRVSYDLSPDDELFGLGVGCDGTMRILVQALTAERDYQPLRRVFAAASAGYPATLATIIEAEGSSSAGAAALFIQGASEPFGMDAALAAELAEQAKAIDTSQCRNLTLGARAMKVLFSVLRPPPAVLVLGAGLDSEPLASLMSLLGWRISVYDHRDAYFNSRNYPAGVRTHCHAAAEIGQQLDLKQFDAAVIMSHHLVSDRLYLEQLLDTGMAYIGLLGPPGRRDRLLKEITASEVAAQRVFGPAGIRLGGRGPMAIALSIVAELHWFLSADGAGIESLRDYCEMKS